jgi:DNA ligase-1
VGLYSSLLLLTLIGFCNSKFFGQPNGTKPPAKQSTLSFSTKSSVKKDTPSSDSAKENDDVEMKEESTSTEIKFEEANLDAKENVKPEKGE